MTYYPVQSPYPIFTDEDGTPLEDGYIYIGEANQNPITNPITISWDTAGLYPAAQPVRTIGGYADRNGSPGIIYVNAGAFEDYSILVTDKNGVQIISEKSARSMFDFIGGNNVDYINDLRSISGYDQPIYVRGHTTIGDGGEGYFEWFDGAAPGTYADNNGTIIVPTGGDGSGSWIRQYSGYIDVKFFGAACDGATDDFDAIRYALHTAWNDGGGTVFLPGPCGISKKLLFDTYDFIPTDALGGGGDGLSVADQINYLTDTVPSIKILGAFRPSNLINGNPLQTKCPGLYWIGTVADDMIQINGNNLAQWRGSINFENVYLDGGDNLTLTSTTAALDGIWINQYANRGILFKNILITKCHKTGLRLGTNDVVSNSIFTNYFQNVASNYNAEYGFVIKGNALTFDECSADRNASGGVVFRKINNSSRWLNGVIQYNTPFQIEFEGGSQNILVDGTYFEGQNHNTVNAVNTANRCFFDFNDGGGSGSPIRTTIKNCRFVFGTTTAGYEEDFVVNLSCIIYGFRFIDNQVNTENAVIISNQGGGSNSLGGFFYNNYFSGGIGITEFTNTTLRDSFYLVINRAGEVYFQEDVVHIAGTETITGQKTFEEETYLGADGKGNSVLWFYDDTNDVWRGLYWRDSMSEWYVTDSGGVARVLYHAGVNPSLGAGTGISGTFTTADAKTVTYTNGIITSVV